MSFVNLTKDLCIFLVIPEIQLNFSLIVPVVFLFSNSLISAVILTVSFLLFTLGLCYPYIYKFLMWEFIDLRFPFFVIYLFNAITFPFRTALAVCHKFWHVLFGFLFRLMHFKRIPLKVLLWLKNCVEMCCLVFKLLETFSCYLLLISAVIYYWYLL